MANKTKSRTKSSAKWLKEHFNDPYVKQAQAEGYRSRAAYKLLEIQKRDKLFKPGMVVVDLGAAPGSWSQLISKLIKPNGKIVALDILPMDPIDDVEFIQGDFSSDEVLSDLNARLTAFKGIDWVVSDIAPNMSGNKGVDIPRAMHLVEMVVDFALQHLNDNGGLLVKVFQGEGFQALMKQLRTHFKIVIARKPEASRDRSREVYLLARDLKRQ